MKYVLLNSNKSSMIELPETYEQLLIKINSSVIDKKLIDTNLIITHKGKIFKKEHFENLNEDINILDISYTLNGGAEYPNIWENIFIMVGICFFIIIIAMVLLIGTSYVIYNFEISNNIQFYDYIMTIYNLFDEKNYWIKEFVNYSIVFFVFSSISYCSLLILKQNKCPSFTLPISIIYLFAIPFIVLPSLLFFINKISFKFLIYFLIILFSSVGFIIYGISTNLLSKWFHVDNKESTIDLYGFPILAIVIYFVLKLLVHSKQFDGSSIFLLFRLLLCICLIMWVPYINILFTYISSPYSICS